MARFSKKLEKFVNSYELHGDIERAIADAGYLNRSVEHMKRQIGRNPALKDAIDKIDRLRAGETIDEFKNGPARFFNTPEELGVLIEAYFENPPANRPTMSGLAYHLGFASRQSLYDYEKDSRFAYQIKRARLLLESFYESNLHTKVSTGSIFALKNMGWADQLVTPDSEDSDTLKIQVNVVDASGK